MLQVENVIQVLYYTIYLLSHHYSWDDITIVTWKVIAGYIYYVLYTCFSGLTRSWAIRWDCMHSETGLKCKFYVAINATCLHCVWYFITANAPVIVNLDIDDERLSTDSNKCLRIAHVATDLSVFREACCHVFYTRRHRCFCDLVAWTVPFRCLRDMTYILYYM